LTRIRVAAGGLDVERTVEMRDERVYEPEAARTNSGKDEQTGFRRGELGRMGKDPKWSVASEKTSTRTTSDPVAPTASDSRSCVSASARCER
jgi:hypothetical protein